MVSIAEASDAVEARPTAWDGRLTVATVNGPDATVVSGDAEAVEQLAAACEQDDVRVRILPVDYASHGPHVDAIRDEVLGALAGITPRQALLPMVSAMTGEFLDGSQLGADYWYASLRAPVVVTRPPPLSPLQTELVGELAQSATASSEGITVLE